MNDLLHHLSVFWIAARPMLSRVLARIMPRPTNEGLRARGYVSMISVSDERSELNDEIRRMTAMLEIGRGAGGEIQGRRSSPPRRTV
jgi:hypothetical protein